MDRSLVQSDVHGGAGFDSGLRRIAAPLLRWCDPALTMTHPFADCPLHLRAYAHRCYWLSPQSRAAFMTRIDALLRRGDTVLEVGGHIGFLSQYVARKVGQTGQVHIFEPGLKNQHFLRRNLAAFSNATIVDCAASHRAGKAMFFEDDAGGFSNAIDPGPAQSAAAHGSSSNQRFSARQVQTATLDSYARHLGLQPDVIKIDAQGGELAVLQGARTVVARARAVVVTVTRDPHAVVSHLHTAGFTLSSEDGTTVNAQARGTIFAERPDNSEALHRY